MLLESRLIHKLSANVAVLVQPVEQNNVIRRAILALSVDD